jgi:hypothetical protein
MYYGEDLLIPALTILLLSCGQKRDYLVPEEIIITGQIINYDHESFKIVPIVEDSSKTE